METHVPRLIILFPTPSDAQDFEKTFREEHEPLVRAQLGANRRMTAGTVVPLGTDSTPYHWMAELHFDTIQELNEAVASDGGLRTGAHARRISTGGPPLMLVLNDVPAAVSQPTA
jgi:uncharacterized protein (TIGR02118 family)